MAKTLFVLAVAVATQLSYTAFAAQVEVGGSVKVDTSFFPVSPGVPNNSFSGQAHCARAIQADYDRAFAEASQNPADNSTQVSAICGFDETSAGERIKIVIGRYVSARAMIGKLSYASLATNARVTESQCDAATGHTVVTLERLPDGAPVPFSLRLFNGLNWVSGHPVPGESGFGLQNQGFPLISQGQMSLDGHCRPIALNGKSD